MSVVYLSDYLGCAYALDGESLITTPMYEDLTYDTCVDNWVEVDKTDFQQGSDELVHIEWVWGQLRVAEQGLFATV